MSARKETVQVAAEDWEWLLSWHSVERSTNHWGTGRGKLWLWHQSLAYYNLSLEHETMFFFAWNWSRSFGAVLETWSAIYSMRGLFSWGTMGCFSIFWELKKSVRECHWQSSTLQFWSEDLLCFELSATNPHYTCCSFCHFNWWIHTHIDLSNIKQTPNCKRGKAAVLLLWQWCTVGLLTYVNPPRMTSPSFLG